MKPFFMRAVTEEDAGGIEQVRELFEAYAGELGENLCFQGFAEELAGLPGKYGPPAGCLLLAESRAGGGALVAGCVALRPLAAGVCEMKRMYVRPAFRGSGVGRLLAEAVVEEGRRMGYRKMRLDTLSRLTAALALYRGMGFVEIGAYCENPLPGVVFMELAL